MSATGPMPREVRLRVCLFSVLPVLVPALVLLPVPAFAGLMPWAVVPAVVLAQGVQAAITYVRLGRTGRP